MVVMMMMMTMVTVMLMMAMMMEKNSRKIHGQTNAFSRWRRFKSKGYRPAWTSISMVIIGVKSGSAVASAIPLPGLHRNIQKLKNQESPTGGDKEISA